MASPSQPVRSQWLGLFTLDKQPALLHGKLLTGCQQVHPLRIQKGTIPLSSPTKSSLPRPLSELAPTEKRRNSPSYNQATKVRLVEHLAFRELSANFDHTEDDSQYGLVSIPVVTVQLRRRLLTTTLLARP
jgi:hypothetical protein